MNKHDVSASTSDIIELSEQTHALLIEAFAVEPALDLFDRLIYQTLWVASRRRLIAARLAIALLSVGMASPLAIFWVANVRGFAGMMWQSVAALFTMIGETARLPGGLSLATIVSLVLVSASAATLFWSAKLARKYSVE